MNKRASTKELEARYFTFREIPWNRPTALDRVRQDEATLRTRLRWLLAIVTIVAFWRVAFQGFINYDDPAFVTANPHVYTGLSLANLKWAFTTLSGDATSYQPLTWLTHQLDCQLFGLQPGAHHLTNLWLHVANALLLFALLDRLTSKPWRSAAVAALFALHPLHVQTVAWVSERKTLVCTLFWLLAMLAHVRFVRSRSRGGYVLVLLLSTAALLSKPIAVCLPFTLLLLDFWPLEASQRPGRLLLEKVPLFVLSALVCWITVLAQADLGALRSLADVPAGVRLANSVMAPALYMRKLVWPVDLSPIDPLREDWPWWQVGAAAGLLVWISIWSARQVRTRPYLLSGWCWYLLTLVPTLSLVQVGLQGMADRYTYVPLVGLFVSVVWGAADALAKARAARMPFVAASAGVFTACLCLTVANVRYWENSTVLFEHAVRVTSNNFIAYRLLGMARQNEGSLRAAEQEYRESLRLGPRRAPTHRCLANVLFLQGDAQSAAKEYSVALKLMPSDAQAHRNLAELFLRTTDPRFHDTQKAVDQARTACELSHYRKREFVLFLAQAYAGNHQPEQAAEAAQRALRLSVGPKELAEAAELLATVSQTTSARNDAPPPPGAPSAQAAEYARPY